MEEKKFDYNSLIGMILLAGIMLWYFNTNAPEIKLKEPTEKIEKVVKSDTTTKNNEENLAPSSSNDSLRQIALTNKFGAFAYGAIKAKEGVTVLENELVTLTIDNKGGQITEALLKKYKTHDDKELEIFNVLSKSFLFVEQRKDFGS